MSVTTATLTDQPRIYVACLAAYNNGILHGAWIAAGTDAWVIWDGINRMLATSPVAGAEEWAIHDYEGFQGIRLHEYTAIERVTEIAAFLEEHGELGAELYNHFGGDIDEAREALTERYHGCHASLADYVQELTEETAAIPESLRYYIDWKAMARDAELSGDLFAIETAHGEVHIFGS